MMKMKFVKYIMRFIYVCLLPSKFPISTYLFYIFVLVSNTENSA